MEAIVLAGGLGTRLRQVVSDLPKPMAPIAGRPFLKIVLDQLAAQGFTKIVLSVGFMADKISAYFGNSYAGMTLVYSIENAPLGTGGAVRLAMNHITADNVFVFNGDTFLVLEAALVETMWQARQRPIIVGREVINSSRYGRLIVREGVVIGIAEKSIAGPGLINAGCYVFGRKQLDGYPLGIPFSLESDYLTHAVPGGGWDVFVTDGKFIDIGIPEDFIRAQIELLSY